MLTAPGVVVVVFCFAEASGVLLRAWKGRKIRQLCMNDGKGAIQEQSQTLVLCLQSKFSLSSIERSI